MKISFIVNRERHPLLAPCRQFFKIKSRSAPTTSVTDQKEGKETEGVHRQSLQIQASITIAGCGGH